MTSPGVLALPLWSSAFRPFLLLAAAYAPLLAVATVLATAGVGGVDPARDIVGWHAREMVLGFALAVSLGVALTALPGWAGLPEVRGAPLALLVLLWLGGRLLAWSGASFTALAIADALLLGAVALLVTPALLRHRRRRFLLLPLLLVAMLAGSAWFAVAGERRGLHMALQALMLLYAAAGGVLIPTFTANRLRETGRGSLPPPWRALEWAALLALAALALADLAALPDALRAAVALAAAAVHGWRLARWRGWRAADDPLVWTLHLGYAWMVVALALAGLGALGLPGGRSAWTHAFAIGALGPTMLGLMTRVALRHTGRPTTAPPETAPGAWIVVVAALLREAVAFGSAGGQALAVAAVLWAAPFALYACRFAPALVGPSLPRTPPSPTHPERSPPLRQP